MNENGTKQWVCVGAVAGAFGVHGDVKIKSFTANPLDCAAYGGLFSDKGELILTPRTPRHVKAFVIVKASEIRSREQAEALKSTKLYVSREVLPETDEDEFYYTDLIGLRVETLEGEYAGRVKAVHDFGGGDILEIQTPGQKDWYHPFTKDAVPHVDLKNGKILIEIIEPDEIEAGDARPHI